MAISNAQREKALKIRAAMDSAAQALSGAQAAQAVEIYRLWYAGESVAVGDIRRYSGERYRCRQAHTTQEDWTPDITPALWTKL